MLIIVVAPVTKTTTQATSSRNTASPTEPSNYSPIGSACGNDATNGNPNTDSGVHDSPNAITTTDSASAATNGTSNVVSTGKLLVMPIFINIS